MLRDLLYCNPLSMPGYRKKKSTNSDNLAYFGSSAISIDFTLNMAGVFYCTTCNRFIFGAPSG